MSARAGLRIDVAYADHALPGYLKMGSDETADVPFHPRQDFPFEDRAVTAIAAGSSIAELDRQALLHFLLECRRVITPGGLVRIATPDGEGLKRLAALAGLERTQQAPLEAEARAESAALDRAGTPPALEFTKRYRGVDSDPLVSVLIPAYNPRFFAACLDSALAQTYTNTEIVVCDDSPGTDIEQIVRSRASAETLRYERNETRLRPRANFIRCFERARGEFVKFLCDDDLLAPTCVSSLLQAFRLAPDISLATSRRQRVDENGRHLGDQPATLPIVAESSVIAGYTLANAMISVGLNTVGEPSTVLFRKVDLLDQAPEYFRFDTVAGRGIIDMVTWTALLLKGDAVYLRDCHSSFRIHPGQRQHDPAMLQRNADSIRSLQGAWLGLGLQERMRPDLLLTKPYPPPAGIDWLERPVQGLAARRVAPTGRTAPDRASAQGTISGRGTG
jgi:hypothetical protein